MQQDFYSMGNDYPQYAMCYHKVNSSSKASSNSSSSNNKQETDSFYENTIKSRNLNNRYVSSGMMILTYEFNNSVSYDGNQIKIMIGKDLQDAIDNITLYWSGNEAETSTSNIFSSNTQILNKDDNGNYVGILSKPFNDEYPNTIYSGLFYMIIIKDDYIDSITDEMFGKYKFYTIVSAK